MKVGLFLVAILMIAGLHGTPAAATRQSLDVRIPEAPTVVRAGGQVQLAYELHLTNFANQPLRLDALVIKDGEDHSIVGTFTDDDLAGLVQIVGGGDPEAPRLIAPGRRAILFINTALSTAHAPRTIAHALTLSDADNKMFQVDSRAVPLDRAPLPRLAPPVRGGPWVAVYAPRMERGHRRVFYAVEGTAVLPGRFAIDWMKVDENGQLAAGNPDVAANHYGMGAEVLAVADGIVVAIRDDVPDPPTASGRDRPTIADASGNFVMLDIGGGRIAIYEHLKQGITVAVGDRVKSGAVIGFLGFTGQASAPHLHFHLADKASILGAEGQPYRLSSWRQLGHYESIEAFGRREKWQKSDTPQRVENSFPAPNIVVSFDKE